MTEHQFEYRAVCYDRPTETDPPTWEHGSVYIERKLAENQLAHMRREVNPTFDEGWIEMRTVGAWRRIESESPPKPGSLAALWQPLALSPPGYDDPNAS